MRALRYLATVTFMLVPLIAYVPAAMPSGMQKEQHGLLAKELISMDELRALQENKTDFVLLDARPQQSYDEAHIESAVLPRTKEYYGAYRMYELKIIPLPPDPDAALTEQMKLTPKDKPIVTYCNVDCSASSILLMKLKKLGFVNVRSMEDGIQAWGAKGYPVVRNK